jgi:hypothetical protein
MKPKFSDYVREAFKPLGVYLRFWKPELRAGTRREFEVMMINDEPRAVKGELQLTLASSKARAPFELPAYGAQTYVLSLDIPKLSGSYELRAAATQSGSREPTVSRRKVRLTSE